jgi:hypothetical protein
MQTRKSGETQPQFDVFVCMNCDTTIRESPPPRD